MFLSSSDILLLFSYFFSVLPPPLSVLLPPPQCFTPSPQCVTPSPSVFYSLPSVCYPLPSVCYPLPLSVLPPPLSVLVPLSFITKLVFLSTHPNTNVLYYSLSSIVSGITNVLYYSLSSIVSGIMAGSPCPIEVMKEVNDKLHMPKACVCYINHFLPLYIV